MQLGESVDFRVDLVGPVDIPASLELFRRHGDDLLDRWDGATLTRTLPVGNEVFPYTATNAGSVEAPTLLVQTPSSQDAEAVETAIRATFLPPPASYPALLLADPAIAALDARFPGLRTVRQFDLFAALIVCVSAQQVNLRWATTTRRRLAEAFGERHTLDGHAIYSLNPARIAHASVAELRALQFTTRKAEYIIAIAEAIASGALDLPTLAGLPDDTVIAQLTAIRGVGGAGQRSGIRAHTGASWRRAAWGCARPSGATTSICRRKRRCRARRRRAVPSRTGASRRTSRRPSCSPASRRAMVALQASLAETLSSAVRNRWGLQACILRVRDISPRLKPGASRGRIPRHDAPGRELKLTGSIAS